VQGWVTFDPEGKQEMSYTWGLGEATNNQVEILAPWQGFLVLKQMGITNLTMEIIHHMVNLTLPQDTQIRKMMTRTQQMLEGFTMMEIHHAFRSLNAIANKNVNLSYTLQMGCLRKIRKVYPYAISHEFFMKHRISNGIKRQVALSVFKSTSIKHKHEGL
jgi:hypothetical protein